MASSARSWRTRRVSRHFTLGEFLRDQEQAPTRAQIAMLKEFARHRLEPLRAAYGPCVIISGHRTPEHNRAVGGALRSWHVWEWHPGELAVDVHLKRGNPTLWAETYMRQHQDGGVGVYSTHLHLDSRKVRAFWRA